MFFDFKGNFISKQSIQYKNSECEAEMKERKYITTIIVSVFVLAAGTFYGYANIKENKTCVTSLSSTMEETKETQESLETGSGNDSKSEEKMNDSKEKNLEQTADVIDEKAEDGRLCVHICGQVKKPGVYEFVAGARISDGIQSAGGLTKKAAADAVNQAEFLEDGTQIYIPSIKEVKTSQVKTKQSKTQQENRSISEKTKDSSKVNLNLATKEELMTLQGIGEAKANSIITYREEHGDFKSIEDIKNITGIKDGVFNSIADDITV